MSGSADSSNLHNETTHRRVSGISAIKNCGISYARVMKFKIRQGNSWDFNMEVLQVGQGPFVLLILEGNAADRL